MDVSLIVAMSRGAVIGKDGKMPWHLPEDLMHFKNLTMGHAILMGRKTYESIGRVLPGRVNIVLSHNPLWQAPEGLYRAHNLDEALRFCEQSSKHKIFIIGGASIYRETMQLCERAYVTYIDEELVGDTYFPIKQLEQYFAKRYSPDQSWLMSKSGLNYRFEEYERVAR